MEKDQSSINQWTKCRIGITGASGSLGKALTEEFKRKGAFVIGLTHGPIPEKKVIEEGPQEWCSWQCGKEKALGKTLKSLDILVLNHGINPKGQQSIKSLNEAIEINALSSWRLIEAFESLNHNQTSSMPREIWVNTSEAEIQPAFSPGYEISKRLIGQLVSIRWNNLSKCNQERLRIRKLILGPFLSELNPLGIMSASFVAKQIIWQADLGLKLIIVTPNPLTYVLVTVNELFRSLYFNLIKKIYRND